MDKYPIKKSVDALIADETARFRALMDAGEIEAMPGAYDLVKAAHAAGFKTAIVSSSHAYEIAGFAAQFGFDKFLDTTVSGEDVEHGKPAPDPFLLAAKDLGVDPKDCTVVEDSENGVKAAKAAGMRCIALKLPHATPQDLSQADITVTHLTKIDLNVL